VIDRCEIEIVRDNDAQNLISKTFFFLLNIPFLQEDPKEYKKSWLGLVSNHILCGAANTATLIAFTSFLANFVFSFSSGKKHFFSKCAQKMV